MRRLLMHPQAGKFRSQGSIEWPDDQYTRRRLADGSIKLAQPPQPAQPAPAAPVAESPATEPEKPAPPQRAQPQQYRARETPKRESRPEQETNE
jgi:hypothetical protein